MLRFSGVLVVMTQGALIGFSAENYLIHSFQRQQLTDQFFSEGASFADFNRDGAMDIVSGPYWYTGPKYVERHEYYPVQPYDPNDYSNNFFAFAYDVNHDKWPDILVIGFPGTEAYWYQNPQGKSGHWPRHLVHPVVDNESPTLADITGDGELDLVFHTGGQLGYAEPDPADPTQPWRFHAISPKRDYYRYTHGLGVGDVNGDGRPDMLEKGAWWEHPAERSKDEFWVRHEVPFAQFGGAQMFAYDFDGDGDNDVVTSKAAHAYGLSWFENVAEGDNIIFREHSIMGETPQENDYGVAFSQLHALALADMDRDGIKDVVTGKRYWAHNGKDPGARDPAVSYWFQTVRKNGTAKFVPHRIDHNSGVGTQVTVGDVNGDKWLDVVVGNKKGTFLLVHHVKEVDQATWEEAQPQRTKQGQDTPAVDTSTSSRSPTTDYSHAGLTPEAAAEAMTVPEGFSVQVCAGEPDVKQPIAMAFDDRGRIWIAEAYEYPRRAPDGEGKDRILIFEDTDGDGRFDKRTVFFEGLNLVSGMEIGFGGVWVGAPPYLWFIPDRDGDDVPDGEPEILLDGWHYEDTHETLNSFIWGPDGWLYGCHGVFTYSLVGKPGTSDDERVPLNAGVWRYHPTRHRFEAFAHGTSNPWGIDFNDQGQAFITACVIPHLYHIIQGGRYQRQSGQHFNPYTYDDIKTIADHSHFEGNIQEHAWWGGREPTDHTSTDEAGGGHAHAGAMIYLGGDWPNKKYRNQIFMNNIHGARLNQDKLVPRGSGYVGQHAPDFLFTHDRASQILNLRYGPDGQVYMIDWYDMQQCHREDPSEHDRENGRIFRVVYQNQPTVAVDLKRLDDRELVDLQLDENDWYVRHARRILQERAASGTLDADVVDRLAGIATIPSDQEQQLRAIWVMHVTGTLSEEIIHKLLADESPYVRGWAIQLAMEACEDSPSPKFLARVTEMARSDPSPVVRLYLASAAQRIPLDARWELLEGLVSHEEDADDHSLPLMNWYALEPIVPTDMSRALDLASKAQIPVIRSYVIRRIVDVGSTEALLLLTQSLGAADDPEDQLTLLTAMNQSLKSRRNFPMPEPWPQIYERLTQSDHGSVRSEARKLAVKFGEPRARAETRAVLSDATEELGQRREALEVLLSAKDPELVAALHDLIADVGLRREALRGLAAYSDAKTPGVVLGIYDSLSLDERRDALTTLASRPEYALQLLEAILAKRVASADLPADLIRQLDNLNSEAVKEKVGEIWGFIRETPEDKKEQIAKIRNMIEEDGPEPDLHLGRAVFAKTCQQCHKLFGTGHTIGPELTGSNRANLDYLLSNVIDPSAIMAKEYQSTVVETEGGRVLTGVVTAEDDQAVTITMPNETVIVPRDEIAMRLLSDTSMMPDNQWQQMKPHEIRSLVAYLASPKQVPMLANQENVSSLFNRQDLTGWTGDARLWKVENGQIVGTSPGLTKNHFLVSDLAVEDFELRLKVKLTPNTGNSGIQFRSEARGDGDVKGYQADIGQSWWGKLYEEHGRGLLWDRSAKEFVQKTEWNDYRIVASGSRIQTYLNDNLCVDLDDPDGARRGIIALQIHSGPAMEVRFKDLRLVVP